MNKNGSCAVCGFPFDDEYHICEYLEDDLHKKRLSEGYRFMLLNKTNEGQVIEKLGNIESLLKILINAIGNLK